MKNRLSALSLCLLGMGPVAQAAPFVIGSEYVITDDLGTMETFSIIDVPGANLDAEIIIIPNRVFYGFEFPDRTDTLTQLGFSLVNTAGNDIAMLPNNITLSSLDFVGGEVISGVFSNTNFIDITSFSNDSISFSVNQRFFRDGLIVGGELLIETTAAVPIPPSLLLLLSGIVSIWSVQSAKRWRSVRSP